MQLIYLNFGCFERSNCSPRNESSNTLLNLRLSMDTTWYPSITRASTFCKWIRRQAGALVSAILSISPIVPFWFDNLIMLPENRAHRGQCQHRWRDGSLHQEWGHQLLLQGIRSLGTSKPNEFKQPLLESIDWLTLVFSFCQDRDSRRRQERRSKWNQAEPYLRW